MGRSFSHAPNPTYKKGELKIKPDSQISKTGGDLLSG